MQSDARFRRAAESSTGIALRVRTYFDGTDLKRKAVTVTAEDVQKTQAFQNLKTGGGHYVTAEQVREIVQEVGRAQNLIQFDEGVAGELDQEAAAIFRSLSDKLGVRPTARSQKDAEELNAKLMAGTGLNAKDNQPIVLRFDYHQQIRKASSYQEANKATREFCERNKEKIGVTAGIRIGPFGASGSIEHEKERIDRGVFADEKAFSDYKAENLTKDGEGVEIVPRGLALVEKSQFLSNVNMTTRTLVLRPTAMMRTIETITPTGTVTSVPPEVVNPVDVAKGLAGVRKDIDDKAKVFEKMLADIAAKTPFGDTIRIHWQTPPGNPLFKELLEGGAGTGPHGARQLTQWVSFPAGRTFSAPPKVVVGLSSLDAFRGQTRVHVDVTKVTKEGFEVRVRTWGDTGLYEADACYTVYPE